LRTIVSRSSIIRLLPSIVSDWKPGPFTRMVPDLVVSFISVVQSTGQPWQLWALRFICERSASPLIFWMPSNEPAVKLRVGSTPFSLAIARFPAVPYLG